MSVEGLQGVGFRQDSSGNSGIAVECGRACSVSKEPKAIGPAGFYFLLVVPVTEVDVHEVRENQGGPSED